MKLGAEPPPIDCCPKLGPASKLGPVSKLGPLPAPGKLGPELFVTLLVAVVLGVAVAKDGPAELAALLKKSPPLAAEGAETVFSLEGFFLKKSLSAGLVVTAAGEAIAVATGTRSSLDVRAFSFNSFVTPILAGFQ